MAYSLFVRAPMVTVLMDLRTEQAYHVATLAALEHAAAGVGLEAHVSVVRTDTIDRALVACPGDAVVVGPGSPYRNPDGVHDVVRSAREHGVPLLGT
jgi:CTP synthase (UTP-ammonia lyase)